MHSLRAATPRCATWGCQKMEQPCARAQRRRTSLGPCMRHALCFHNGAACAKINNSSNDSPTKPLPRVTPGGLLPRGCTFRLRVCWFFLPITPDLLSPRLETTKRWLSFLARDLLTQNGLLSQTPLLVLASSPIVLCVCVHLVLLFLSPIHHSRWGAAPNALC